MIIDTNNCAKNEVGNRYGSLVVLSYAGRHRYRNRILWLCMCDCGIMVVVMGGNLRSGNTTNCGCYRKKMSGERGKARFTTHGMTGSGEFSVWNNMKDRCYNPKHKNYKDYGMRGIRVCDRWLNSFENFFADMGYKPSPQHTIDRIDNDGNYEPSNCRWATQKQQQRNKRNSLFVEFNGEKINLKDLAEIKKIPYHRLWQRLKAGMPLDKAISNPSRTKIWKGERRAD